jgi:hypothetical protein
VEAAIRQFQGVHPVGSKYHSDAYKTRSRLFRPKTRAAIRKNEAIAAEALFSARDVLEVSTDDDEDPIQQKAAEFHKYLLQHRLKKSIPWFLLSMGAYQEAQVIGTCISHQYWEYDPKRKIDQPRMELIPIENFRFDPAAQWFDVINTSAYLIQLIPMYVKDVKARMVQPDPKTGAPKWKAMDDSQLLVAANSYLDTTRLTRERGRTDSTAQVTAINNFTIVWVHRVIMPIDGVDHIWYTLGNTALLSDPVPLTKQYAHGKRPYAMGYAAIEAHKTYPEGVSGITKDSQAEINDVANMRIDNWKYAMHKRYFVQRNSQIDIRSLTRNVPGAATLMNDVEKDVKVIDTADVTSAAAGEQDRLNLDFDDVAGSFSPSSVGSNRKLSETVGGMNILTSNAHQVGAYQLRTWAVSWAIPALEQIMALEAYYEEDVALLRRASEACDLKSVGIDVTEEFMLTETTLNIDIGQGSTNSKERADNFLAGLRSLREILQDGTLEKYGLDVKDVTTELFSNLGYRSGGRFFDRADDPNLKALKDTIADLQAQLEAKVPQALMDAQIEKIQAEIEAMVIKGNDIRMGALEKAVRAFFAAHQTGQMVATVPQLAPVADAVLDSAATMSGNPPTAGNGVPMPAGPMPGFTQDEVADPRTGVKFTPGAVAAGDTSPNTPANPATPGSPMTGAQGGIETMRNEAA